MAINPKREGSMYFIKVANIGPLRASLFAVISLFIAYLIFFKVQKPAYADTSQRRIWIRKQSFN
jgi:Na+/alanine symporter